jgi:cyclopropane-fatty-acyl-phospholipid synthase
MWSLYLRSCAASFRVSGLNIHQLLFSKGLNNSLPLTFEHVYTGYM